MNKPSSVTPRTVHTSVFSAQTSKISPNYYEPNLQSSARAATATDGSQGRKVSKNRGKTLRARKPTTQSADIATATNESDPPFLPSTTSQAANAAVWPAYSGDAHTLVSQSSARTTINPSNTAPDGHVGSAPNKLANPSSSGVLDMQVTEDDDDNYGTSLPRSVEDIVVASFIHSWVTTLNQLKSESQLSPTNSPLNTITNYSYTARIVNSSKSREDRFESELDAFKSVKNIGLYCIKALVKNGHPYLSSMKFVSSFLQHSSLNSFGIITDTTSSAVHLNAAPAADSGSAVRSKEAPALMKVHNACPCLLCCTMQSRKSSEKTFVNNASSHPISHTLKIFYMALDVQNSSLGLKMWLVLIEHLSQLTSNVHKLYDMLQFISSENSELVHLVSSSQNFDESAADGLISAGNIALNIWEKRAMGSWLKYMQGEFSTKTFVSIAELYNTMADVTRTVLFKRWIHYLQQNQRSEDWTGNVPHAALTDEHFEQHYTPSTCTAFLTDNETIASNDKSVPLAPKSARMERLFLTTFVETLGEFNPMCDESNFAQVVYNKFRSLLSIWPFEWVEKWLVNIFFHVSAMTNSSLSKAKLKDQGHFFALPLFTSPTLHRLQIINQMTHSAFGAALTMAFQENTDGNPSQTSVKSLAAWRTDRNLQDSQVFMVQDVSVDLFIIYLEIGLLQEAEIQAWLGYQFAGSYNAEALYAFNMYRIQYAAGHFLSAFHQLMIAIERAELSKNTYKTFSENTLFILGQACLEVARLLSAHPVLIHHLTVNPVSLKHSLAQFECEESSKETDNSVRFDSTGLVRENLISSSHTLLNYEIFGKERTHGPSKMQDKKGSTSAMKAPNFPEPVCNYIVSNAAPQSIVMGLIQKSFHSFKNDIGRFLTLKSLDIYKNEEGTKFISLNNLLAAATRVARCFCDVAGQYGDKISAKSLQEAKTESTLNLNYLQLLGGTLKAKALLLLANIEMEGNDNECRRRLIPSLLRDILEYHLEHLDKEDATLFWGLLLQYAEAHSDSSKSLYIEVSKFVLRQMPKFEENIKFWDTHARLASVTTAGLPYEPSTDFDYRHINAAEGFTWHSEAKGGNSCESPHKVLHAALTSKALQMDLILSLAAAAASNSKEFLSKFLLGQNGNAGSSVPDLIARQLLYESHHLCLLPKTCVRGGDSCRRLLHLIDISMEKKMSRYNHPDSNAKWMIWHCIGLAFQIRSPYMHLQALLRLCLYESRDKNLPAVFNLLAVIWHMIEGFNSGPTVVAEAHYLHGKALVALCSKEVLRNQAFDTPPYAGNSISHPKRSARGSSLLSFPLSSGTTVAATSDDFSHGRNWVAYYEKNTAQENTLSNAFTPKRNASVVRNAQSDAKPDISKLRQSIQDERADTSTTPPSALRLKKKARVRHRSKTPERYSGKSEAASIAGINVTLFSSDFIDETLFAAKKHIQSALFLWEKYGYGVGIPVGIQQAHRLREVLFMLFTLQNKRFSDSSRSSSTHNMFFSSPYLEKCDQESCTLADSYYERLLEVSRTDMVNPFGMSKSQNSNLHIPNNPHPQNNFSASYMKEESSELRHSDPLSWISQTLLGKVEKAF